MGAAVLDEQRRLFLIQSSGKFGSQWIIPGGKIQRGERAVDALKREFREETGLVIDDIEFVGMRELIEPDRHLVCLEFLARADSRQKITLNEEAVDGGWFTAEELKALEIVPLTKLLIEEELIAKGRMG